MTALTRYFFDAVYLPRSAWAVVAWWETRRAAYNAAVGGAGLVTLAGAAAFGALPPLEMVVPIVVLYGVLANVCYSFGALVDLAARRLGGPRFALVGPTLLRYGFVFSVGLTLFPLALAALAWTLRLVGVIHGAPSAAGPAL